MKFLGLAALVLGVGSALTVAACGDDEPPPEPSPEEFTPTTERRNYDDITNLHSEIVEFEDGTTAHCVYDYNIGIWCR